MTPKFSVVIPTYNRASLLPRALDSVLKQTYPPNEIIVVDDGSSDATARTLGERYPRVSYCYQRHGGVSAARNLGVLRAQSEWVAFLDSDDAWGRTKLAAQASAIDAHPSVKLFHTNESWLRDGQPLAQKRQHRKYGGDIFKYCLPRCVISPSSAVIQRDVLIRIGGFDESLRACEDYDLWLRFCAQFPVHFVDQPLVTKYGGHPDQLSQCTVGLDQYRIIALVNLLESGILSTQQREPTVAMLTEKTEIFLAGARKRSRQRDIDKYTALTARHTQ